MTQHAPKNRQIVHTVTAFHSAINHLFPMTQHAPKNGQFVVIYCKYIKKQSYGMHFNKAGGVMLNENK